MGYSGGGSGFGGQMAEWLPAPESADVALLPSIHLGNALHATRDNPVAFVRPGEVFRVSAVVAASMVESGLVKMC
ncbi:hypothetical protein K4L13_004474 [Escherichia coli]|nr:hypothetical protein [Escherichia coli]